MNKFRSTKGLIKEAKNDEVKAYYKNPTEDNFSAPWKYSGQAKVLIGNLNEDEMKGLNRIPRGVIIHNYKQHDKIHNFMPELQRKDGDGSMSGTSRIGIRQMDIYEDDDESTE
jgi:hypothetical protein